MIRFIKNIVDVVKSFITEDLDDDFVPNEPLKKDIESFKKVFEEAAKDPDFKVLLPTCLSDNEKNINFPHLPAQELVIDDNQVVETSEQFNKRIEDNTNEIKNQLGIENLSMKAIKDAIKAGNIDFSKLYSGGDEIKQSMNELVDIANDLEKNDFAEIKSIISDLSEKLTQYNKWLLELNGKISDYENRYVLQAVLERPDNGGYGINLPLDVLEHVSDEEFFKNKDVPDVLLANAENVARGYKPGTIKDVCTALNIIASNFSGKLQERDEFFIDPEYESNLKKEQKEALQKFKEMH